jgi:hypothetical protein
VRGEGERVEKESSNKLAIEKHFKQVKFISILLLFLIMFWVSVSIHEFGHYLIAIISGISLSNIHLHFILLFPCAVSIPPNSISSGNLTLFHYAGGFFSGIILLSSSIFIFKISRKRLSWIYWIIASFAISFSLAEFYEGFREGNNNTQYREFAYQWDFLFIFFATMFLLLLWRFRKNVFRYFKKPD